MPDDLNQPRRYDAVIGTNNPPPVTIELSKWRCTYACIVTGVLLNGPKGRVRVQVPYPGLITCTLNQDAALQPQLGKVTRFCAVDVGYEETWGWLDWERSSVGGLGSWMD